MLGDLLRQIHRNDGLHEERISRHFVMILSLAADEVKEEQSDFISGQKPVVIPVLYCDTAAITIRVGSKK